MKKIIILLIFAVVFTSCDKKPENTYELLTKSLSASGGIQRWRSIQSWEIKQNFSKYLSDKKVEDLNQTKQVILPYNIKLTSYKSDEISHVYLTNSETNRVLYQYQNGVPTAAVNVSVKMPYINEDLGLFDNVKPWSFSENLWNGKTYYSIKNEQLKIEHLYDQKTYLKTVTIKQTDYGETVITYTDYRSFNEFLFPFLVENKASKYKYKEVTHVTEISLNTKIDTEIFKVDDRWRKIVSGEMIPKLPESISKEDMKFITSKLDNKLVLIDFWATWCKPCIKEFPNLKNLYNEYKSKGFEILAISLDDKKQTAENFLLKRKISWPNITFTKAFDSDIAKVFEVAAIPRAILVDKQGKIIALDESAKGKRLENTLKEYFK